MTVNPAAIRLRPVTSGDAEMLFHWRNDAETRRNSLTDGVVVWESHIEWLRDKIASELCRFEMAEYERTPVGTVRADELPCGTKRLSWTVSPEWRGQGFGSSMLNQFVVNLGPPLRAEIKSTNVASIRMAERAGLTFERAEGEVVYYGLER